jgi:hypothetical protein
MACISYVESSYPSYDFIVWTHMTIFFESISSIGSNKEINGIWCSSGSMKYAHLGTYRTISQLPSFI